MYFEILKKEKPPIARLFHKLIQENKLYANLSEEQWIDINYRLAYSGRQPYSYGMLGSIPIIPASTKIKENVNLNGVVRFGVNW